jgi:hypothetical protein
MALSELEKSVIEYRRKRAKRLRRNYFLARGFGYTAEESSLLQNQGHATIAHQAYQENRELDGTHEQAELWGDILGEIYDIWKQWHPKEVADSAKFARQLKEKGNGFFSKNEHPNLIVSGGNKAKDVGHFGKTKTELFRTGGGK